MLFRIARILFWTLAVVVSLLVFPASLYLVVAFWWIVALLATRRGSGWQAAGAVVVSVLVAILKDR